MHLLRRLQRFASGLDQSEIYLSSVVVAVVAVVVVVAVVDDASELPVVPNSVQVCSSFWHLWICGIDPEI